MPDFYAITRDKVRELDLNISIGFLVYGRLNCKLSYSPHYAHDFAFPSHILRESSHVLLYSLIFEEKVNNKT